MYPRSLTRTMCDGIAAQKKVDELGVRARPIMSLEEMFGIDHVASGDECPSKQLHDDHEEGMVAFDDVSGMELRPELMVQARRDEMQYFKEMGVYDKVDLEECWRETGKAPIGVRWVDINKGDTENPKYRSRLVAKEFNVDNRPDVYAAAPLLEALEYAQPMMNTQN